MSQQISISLTEKQLELIISGLLFSCSVNVVSNTTQEYQTELYTLAQELKQLKPDIKLDDIQFLREDNYEDALSPLIFEDFGSNMKILTFDQI